MVFAFVVGVAGAWAANSCSLVRIAVVELLLVELLPPVFEPFALRDPLINMAPPVTLIDPVDPPVVLNAPLTVTA